MTRTRLRPTTLCHRQHGQHEMPPRYAYWTIILEGKPTAFRAHTEEELLPTLKQLQARHPDTVLRWFSRGRLWNSKDEERLAQEARKAKRQSRGREWRPGGAHRDPRDRFKVPRDEKRRRFRDRLYRDRQEGETPGSPEGKPKRDEKRPWKPARPPKKEGARPWNRGGPPPGRRGGGKPSGSRGGGKPGGGRGGGNPGGGRGGGNPSGGRGGGNPGGGRGGGRSGGGGSSR